MPYDFIQDYPSTAVSFLNSKGETQYRGVLGNGTQQDPGFVSIAFPPSYATGGIVRKVTDTLKPILTFDCRGMNNDYYRLYNRGFSSINSFRLEVQALENSQFWEPIAQSPSDFTDNTGTIVGNPYRVIRRSYGSPYLTPGDECWFTLNLRFFAFLRMSASCPIGKETELVIQGTHVWDWNAPPE